jgi:ABC-type multidrug transport system permease subunit
MNFDDIKSKMDQESMNQTVPKSIKDLSASQLPVHGIRKKFVSEIVAMMAVMFFFITIPFIEEMHALPRSVYICFTVVVVLITFGYLLKMLSFLKKTKYMDIKMHSALYSFIFEIKLTLEVYKVGVISSSLLLPFITASFFFGRVDAFSEDLFSKWFLLEIPASSMMMLLIGYLLIAVFFYVVTILWIKQMYGKHVEALEMVLKDLEE